MPDKPVTEKKLREVLRDYPTEKRLKQILQDYPTKKDLADALSNYPTKTDLAIELANYSSKSEVNLLREEMNEHFDILTNSVDKLSKMYQDNEIERRVTTYRLDKLEAECFGWLIIKFLLTANLLIGVFLFLVFCYN